MIPGKEWQNKISKIRSSFQFSHSDLDLAQMTPKPCTMNRFEASWFPFDNALLTLLLINYSCWKVWQGFSYSYSQQWSIFCSHRIQKMEGVEYGSVTVPRCSFVQLFFILVPVCESPSLQGNNVWSLHRKRNRTMMLRQICLQPNSTSFKKVQIQATRGSARTEEKGKTQTERHEGCIINQV
jgi:hypothetical protein